MIRSILLPLPGIPCRTSARLEEKITEKAASPVLVVPLAIVLLAATGAATPGNHRTHANEPKCANTALQQAVDQSISLDRVVGEVADLDLANKRMTIKTAVGNVVTALLDEKIECFRVSPGESSLDKSVKISLSEIRVGDKVYVRGRLSDDGKRVPAQKLIVMSKTDIEKRREREQQEWRQRGIVGSIAAINPKTREVSLQVRGRDGVRTVVATTPDGCAFRRYAAGSVRFSDARPSSFAELKAGDQFYGLGERSADGSRFTAAQVVSGSFRLIGGTVTAVRADSNEIAVTLLGGKQQITVVVNENSALRRMPAQLAMAFAQINRSVQPGTLGAQTAQGNGAWSGGGQGQQPNR